MKTLIVEDMALFRELLRKICRDVLLLELVAEAESGEEAVKVICDQRPDLVILDLFLPDMDGFQVIRSVRHPLFQPRFLAVSARNDPHVLHRVECEGFDGYIDKGTSSIEVLREAVTALKEGRCYWQRLRSLLRQQNAVPALQIDRVLSPRERQILRLIGYALSDEEIAQVIGLSACTVQSFRSHIMKKLAINGTPKLIRFALDHGITDLNCTIYHRTEQMAGQ